MSNVLIFEEGAHFLDPVTATRPIFDVLVGATTPLGKIERYFGHLNLGIFCRPELQQVVRLAHPDRTLNQINIGAPLLLINGRVLMTEGLATQLMALPDDQDTLLVQEDVVMVAKLCSLAGLDKIKHLFASGVPSQEILRTLRAQCLTQKIQGVALLQAPWDLFTHLGESIREDFRALNRFGIIKGTIQPFSVLYEENNIYVGQHTTIEDFVVLDARKGPIYIDEHCTITAGSRLEGPLYLGRHCHVLGARLTHVAIGDHCKVGGEVSMSIFQGYTNKAHDGFVGHSYLGEWVNVGAGSNTSNLKNTYGPITLTIGENKIKTPVSFLGSLIGDHVKLGIGTHLNTGSVVGVGSVLWGTGLHATYVPPFSFGDSGGYVPCRFENFLETATRMMARRKHALTAFHEAYFEWVFARREQEE